jgi:hypothetical protein
MATIQHGASSFDSTSSSVVTFTALGLPTATNRNKVAYAFQLATNDYISTVVAGGQSGTMRHRTVNTSPAPDMRLEIWDVEGVTGTSANVVVTLASGDGDISVQSYGLYDAGAVTDTDDLTGSGATIALTALTVPTDGVAVFGWASNLTTACTWTNATEAPSSDATVGGDRHCGAYTSTAGTNTITADGATGQQVIIGVAWGNAERLADASLTQAGNTVTATATVDVQAAASITQAADTITAVYNTAGEILADASLTQAANTVTSTGTVDVAAAASITQAAQTVTSTGTVETFAAASITQAAQTLSATAAVDVVASSSLTQAANTLSAVYTVTTSAVLDTTQDANTVSASFFSGSFAEATLTQAANTISATAQLLGQAASSMTQGANTIAATATMLIQAIAILTQAAHTMGVGLVERVLRGFARASISGGPTVKGTTTGGQTIKTKTGMGRPRGY